MENSKELKKNSGVVSVKLTNSEKFLLAQQADKEGKSISDLLREKIKEEAKEKLVPQAVEKTEKINISDESLLVIDAIITEKVNSIKRTPPEREYLRKVAGQSTGNSDTLSKEEELFLENLSQSIKAEAVENLLQEHNCVAIEPIFANDLQKRTFKAMLLKRNEVISEKLPSFNQVFLKAISQAFIEDNRRVYDKNLFKATYGFTYDEFLAVFDKD